MNDNRLQTIRTIALALWGIVTTVLWVYGMLTRPGAVDTSSTSTPTPSLTTPSTPQTPKYQDYQVSDHIVLRRMRGGGITTCYTLLEVFMVSANPKPIAVSCVQE